MNVLFYKRLVICFILCLQISSISFGFFAAKGDLNSGSTVDQTDVQILYQVFDTTNSDSGQTGDSYIDFEDVALVSRYYGIMSGYNHLLLRRRNFLN